MMSIDRCVLWSHTNPWYNGGMPNDPALTRSKLAERYTVFGELATGGMAKIHLGRLEGPIGFSRTVAIKSLHPTYARDRDFVSMFIDEARLAARIQHPHVVSIRDVVVENDELHLVMDYITGVTLGELANLLRISKKSVSPSIAATITCHALYGLHAAHEAQDEHGKLLEIVHRDVSPQNLMVGVDGITRVLDFGVARAISRVHVTRDGEIKGKLGYMPPEQLLGASIDRRADIYAMGVVLWEMLTGRRLFAGDTIGGVVGGVLLNKIPAPSQCAADIPSCFDEIVRRSTSEIPERRYTTAQEMAAAIEAATTLASLGEIGNWVKTVAADELERRANKVAEVERATATTPSEIRHPAFATSSEVKAVASADPQDVAVEASSTQHSNSHAFSSEITVTQTLNTTQALQDSKGVDSKEQTVAKSSRIQKIAVVSVLSVAIIAFVGYQLRSFRPVEDTKLITVTNTPVSLPPAVSNSTESNQVATVPVSSAFVATSTEPTTSIKSQSTATLPPRDSSKEKGPVKPTETAAPKTTDTSKSDSKKNCNPPYTIDAEGFQIPKPGCR